MSNAVSVTVGLAVALVALVALFAPVPERRNRWTAKVAFWRWETVRQRLQKRRPLLVAYLGLAVVATAVAVIWALPAVLTRHPQIDNPAERHQAIAATRTGLVAMLVALGATGGLAYTARTYRLSREGQITDRYSKAVGQLSSDTLEVRLGGIYALERLMRDSSADQPTIMEVLAAYVRHRAPRMPRVVPVARDRRVAGHGRRPTPAMLERPAEDAQAVLTVLGRRRRVDGENPIELQATTLRGAWLFEADLIEAELLGADLTGATLSAADLTEAQLFRADLIGAQLDGANLTGAQLGEANLCPAPGSVETRN